MTIGLWGGNMNELDAKQFVHLPTGIKILALAMLLGGMAASLAVIYLFFDSTGSRDWGLIGISGGQFMLTTFVVALVLFYSQTDANIDTLSRSADRFLAADGVLGGALARVTPADGQPLRVERGSRRDLFGYDYALLDRKGATVMRLWCGLNVNRFIVIYRLADPLHETRGRATFVARLRAIFAFSFGGAEAVSYKVNYEPVPDLPNQVSVWLSVATEADLLTNPALKLFWSQDIAMMTESVLRTALRHTDDVRLETVARPLPL